MSYILEALKKLERDRQRERMPNLLTVQEDHKPATKKRTLWPYIVIGLILVNVVFIFLLFRVDPWTNTVVSTRYKNLSKVETATPAPSTAIDEKSGQLPMEPRKDITITENKDFVQPSPLKTRSDLPKKTPHEPSPTKTEPLQPSPPREANVEKPSKAIKPALAGGKILSIGELPADTRAGLPELKMTVHSYNEHMQSRFVVINNSILREGQSINADLKVEQITQNGVVLNSRGYRFILKINENL
ncbi:MAG: general secretion pathway protein GspB [Syntrophorhabdus sp.]|nr:general secretion pathway protein GspB [Syntrophorhabdus sp.]